MNIDQCTLGNEGSAAADGAVRAPGALALTEHSGPGHLDELIESALARMERIGLEKRGWREARLQAETDALSHRGTSSFAEASADREAQSRPVTRHSDERFEDGRQVLPVSDR